MSKKEFLVINDIIKLSGVDKTQTELMIRNNRIQPMFLEPVNGTSPVKAYMTVKIKKMLAARGRVIPGFNEEFASQRQWLEIFDDALENPVSEEWYFPPVNPDPIVRIKKEKAKQILDKISNDLKVNDEPEEVLRLIADSINIMSREDKLPLARSSEYKGTYIKNRTFFDIFRDRRNTNGNT